MMAKLLVAVLEAAIKAILATHLFDLDLTVWVCGGAVVLGAAFWLGTRERGPADKQIPEQSDPNAMGGSQNAPHVTVPIEIHIHEGQRNPRGRTKRRSARRKP